MISEEVQPDEVQGDVGQPIKSLPAKTYSTSYAPTPLPDRTANARIALQQLRDARKAVNDQIAIAKEDRMDAENNLKMLEAALANEVPE